MRGRILIVDDEPSIRLAIRLFLETRGAEVTEAGDCASAEREFGCASPDVAIVDYQLPDGNALELLPRLRALDPTVPLVILTGFGSIDLAVRAIKEGADQFLTKPVEMPTLAVLLERLIETRRDRRRSAAGRVSRSREQIDPFRGESQAIRSLAAQASRLLASESPILLQGETGTGKGVLARWFHENGPRADEAFVDVNCAGLSREFLETELFGHEKGAYTGAVSTKQGLLEVAHKGTVFLDEIGDVDPQVQPKLLKVIEERRFRRLGGIQDRQVDVRLITATHQDLLQAVEERRFRSDLYYRICAIAIKVPPLRERGSDVCILARSFLDEFAALGRGPLVFSPEAELSLRRYHWPGNIRELRNVIERAALLSDGPTITPEGLGLAPRPQTAAIETDTSLTLEELERRHIEAVLAEVGGRVDAAARRLGIHRSSLYNKLKRYRAEPSES